MSLELNLLHQTTLAKVNRLPTLVQVESDVNFPVILQYLASFAHDLPQPLEMKAGSWVEQLCGCNLVIAAKLWGCMMLYT